MRRFYKYQQCNSILKGYIITYLFFLIVSILSLRAFGIVD